MNGRAPQDGLPSSVTQSSAQVPGVRLSRRHVLRGLGVAAGLPWLEAMMPSTVMAATPGKPPVRLGFFYVPNGVHMPAWRPGKPEKRESGIVDTALNDTALNADQLPAILSPLARHGVSDRVVVMSNLEAQHCKMPEAGHEPSGGGFLVGKKCKHSESPEVGGISVDQLAARELGLSTPVDSLALGIDPGHRGDHGYSGTYLSHISWRSPTTPATLELNPRNLYERLFRGRRPSRPDWNADPAATVTGQRDPVEASILDLIREDTRSLQRDLGFADRRRLEEYLDGLRNIERRIQLADRDTHSHHLDSFTEDPANRALHPGENPDDIPELIMPDGRGIPSVYAEHVNLMLDILTLAYQTDTTRVNSFLFSYEKSGRSYPEINAPGSHHSTSHHQGQREKHDELTCINSHHMDLFARMLDRMSRIDEGGSTLLDNVAFLYGSGISDGNQHNHDDLPILVAGGGGGAIAGGRHVAMDRPTPLCNVYLDMLSACGIGVDSFGDSTGPTGRLASV